MPANWVSFTAKLKLELGAPNQKTISDVADIHATAYYNAISQASIVLSQSTVSTFNKSAMKSALELVFTALKELKKEIKPNYSNGDPQTPEEEDARSLLQGIFLPVSTAICLTWQSEIFTPALVPPGYVSPSPGYNVIFPGDPIELSKDLAKGFFIAQSITVADLAISTMASTLVEAYTKHLLTISGVFNGLVPGSPPVPGPPLPFVGVA